MMVTTEMRTIMRIWFVSIFISRLSSHLLVFLPAFFLPLYSLLSVQIRHSPTKHRRGDKGRWKKIGLGPGHALKAWTLVVLVVLLPSCLFVSWIYERLPNVLPASQVPSHQFSEDRARRHLIAIVEGIGTRQGGSEACERTKEYILKELKTIQDEKCLVSYCCYFSSSIPAPLQLSVAFSFLDGFLLLISSHLHHPFSFQHPRGCALIEVDVQTSGRGAYFVDFMDHIITNTYSSITNIVVRVSNGTLEGKNDPRSYPLLLRSLQQQLKVFSFIYQRTKAFDSRQCTL
jgi:hypothetical protein